MAEQKADDASGVTGEYVALDGESYFRIENCHLMPDFFMSIVGASDHWMFISSQGALTAGRRNPDNALFPYASDDQISATRSTTGSLTLIRTEQKNENGRPIVWQPFYAGDDSQFVVRRNIYKTPLGTKVVFEEVNETLGLAFRYRWAFSQTFGFVRSCRLENVGNKNQTFAVLDGLQNLLPYGINSEFHMRFSNLANAYKKSELLDDSALGIFYLSSIPTDKAEPSEGLKATVAWQTGLQNAVTLISRSQLDAFRTGAELAAESDVRGKACAYLTATNASLAPGSSIEWQVVAELAQDHADIVSLNERLTSAQDMATDLTADILASENEFLKIVASSDGMQCGGNRRRTNRHLSNTVFNLMRGGVPLDSYDIPLDDFREHIAKFNQTAFERHSGFLDGLPSSLPANQLRSQIQSLGDPCLTRLAMEYLPLAFSRRHGDPTRPWNRFSIDLVDDSGKPSLNYQGNWRDIFQNWEALGISFPGFTTAMICRFVNATTADGYNPYKVTKDGFAWEEPAPDDPWANIGYWGDHQIIYLLKLLEWTRKFSPAGIDQLLNCQLFTHANIPYRIKSYEEIRENPCDTIVFDHESNAAIHDKVAELGSDGKLLFGSDGKVLHVTLIEKLLTLSLAKLSNFVPDGGIWLNTQRPEWNDANNALVGNGLSMVTTCYLFRWFTFVEEWVTASSSETFDVSKQVAAFLHQIVEVLQSTADWLEKPMNGSQRKEIVDRLSIAGSKFREHLYDEGLHGAAESLSKTDVLRFCAISKAHLQKTIRNNRRPDGLFHAYNLIDLTEDQVEVEHLYEMLEGQVAILSAGILSPAETADLLDRLRASALYRENQDSYLLYPDRQLPRFLEKNRISDRFVKSNRLIQRLLDDGQEQIVKQDANGDVHFAGDFRNSSDLERALSAVEQSHPAYAELIADNRETITSEFESTFSHREFTGRSGTFFAYEGLGSIYWHMVSKLVLAVLENYFAAIDQNADQETIARLAEHFQSIRRGIGAEKSPAEYGAFPTDPYSHTPENAGVKQPGMTGQVKEDILSRFAELGIHIIDGCLEFRMSLFDRDELLSERSTFEYFDLSGNRQRKNLESGTFAFTLFQVPFVYRTGESNQVEIKYADGKQEIIDGCRLHAETSRKLFSRSGLIQSVNCRFDCL